MLRAFIDKPAACDRYKEANFSRVQTMTLISRTLNLGLTPALIVVDVVNGFTDPSCALGTACPDVVTANKILLAEFRRQNYRSFSLLSSIIMTVRQACFGKKYLHWIA